MIARKTVFSLAAVCVAASAASAQVIELTENFTSPTQTTGGWTLSSGFWPAQNNSDNPAPSSSNGGAWGPGGTLFVPAPGGAYFATDTTATGNNVGTVSDWLMTPVLTLHNGDVLKFATRTRSPEEGPSRLEIRLSTAGSSSNVGTLPSDVGSFTQLVATINPNLTANAYPTSWAAGMETFTISGLAATTTGRIAFHTFYPSGGFGGPNGDTVGLATVTYTTALVTSFTWTGATSGSWNNTGNWSPTGIPVSSVDNQLTFGATTHGAMTNDIIGTLSVNSLTFNAGSPVYILSGNPLNFQSNSSAVLPQIVTNSANGITISAGLTLTNNLTVSGSGNLAFNGAVSGPSSLTMSGTGTLTLGNASNSYSGGTNVQGGTLKVNADGDLGTGNVTGASLATISFTGNTTTAKSFAMNLGTITVGAGLTVTFNGGPISGATLDGAGTFATSATNGARFVAVTSTPTVSLTANSPNDQFIHFTNNAALTVPAGINTTGTSGTVFFNGFTNEVAGVITVGAGSRINTSNFQSYGTLNLTPATGSQITLLTNVGTTPLGFNGLSQTFIGTPGTAGTNVAGVDLHGQNLIIADGLFVNNGFVADTVGGGSVIVDYASLYKGAGINFVNVVTQNGGRVQAGNSPGRMLFGTLTIGPGGVQNFNWQINDARGVAGPGGPTGTPVSGWSQLKAVIFFNLIPSGTGDLTWTATSAPGSQFNMSLFSLLNPSPVGTDNFGMLENFHGRASAPPGPDDGDQSFVWPIITWFRNYSGPTDDATLTADTQFDTSQFQNQFNGTFSLHFDAANKSIDLVYTPTAVPEPGTLGLVGLGLLAIWRRGRRRV